MTGAAKVLCADLLWSDERRGFGFGRIGFREAGGPDELGECARGEGKQAAALGAGEAKLFISSCQVDLAVAEAVIVVLSRSHHVAELALAVELHCDPPILLIEEKAAGGV
jgi:hypothetical protein